MNGLVRTPERVGQPLHIIGQDGSFVRSFGDEEGAFRADRRHLIVRATADGRDGSIWSARQNEYVIENWDSTGTLRLRMVRQATWFPTYENPVLPTPSRPPSSWLVAVQYDNRGVLWTAVAIAARQYRRALSRNPITTEGGQEVYSYENQSYLWDTVIEAIDVRSGAVLARQTTEAWLVHFLPDGHFAAYRQDDDGVPYVDVFRVNLAGLPAGRDP
jgi:hypothetical protein